MYKSEIEERDLGVFSSDMIGQAKNRDTGMGKTKVERVSPRAQNSGFGGGRRWNEQWIQEFSMR